MSTPLISGTCEADMHAVCTLTQDDGSACECPCHINMVMVLRQANADKLARIGDLLVEGQPVPPSEEEATRLRTSVGVQGSDMHYVIALLEGFYEAIPEGDMLLYKVQLGHETWKGEGLDKLIEVVPQQMAEMVERMAKDKGGPKLTVARGVPRGLRGKG